MWVGLSILRGVRRLLRARPEQRLRLAFELFDVLVSLGRFLWVCLRLLLTLVIWRLFIVLVRLLFLAQWIVVQIRIGWIRLKIWKCQFFIHRARWRLQRAQWRLQRAHRKEAEARERVAQAHRVAGQARAEPSGSQSRRNSVSSSVAPC